MVHDNGVSPGTRFSIVDNEYHVGTGCRKLCDPIFYSLCNADIFIGRNTTYVFMTQFREHVYPRSGGLQGPLAQGG